MHAKGWEKWRDRAAVPHQEGDQQLARPVLERHAQRRRAAVRGQVSEQGAAADRLLDDACGKTNKQCGCQRGPEPAHRTPTCSADRALRSWPCAFVGKSPGKARACRVHGRCCRVQRGCTGAAVVEGGRRRRGSGTQCRGREQGRTAKLSAIAHALSCMPQGRAIKIQKYELSYAPAMKMLIATAASRARVPSSCGISRQAAKAANHNWCTPPGMPSDAG